MRYSIEPRDLIFVKGYGFLSPAESMDRYIGNNISKNLSGKYSQKLLDHAKKSATDTHRTVSKTAEANGDLIGNTFADKNITVSRISQPNGLKTVDGETENTGFDREIPKIYIDTPPEKREEIIDKLRLV